MAVHMDLNLMLGGHRGGRAVDERLRARLVVERLGPKVDPKHGQIRHDIVG